LFRVLWRLCSVFCGVLMIMHAMPRLKILHVQVHFIVAACENMISGTSMRPGDIVTTSNGKTIEVWIYYIFYL